MKMINRNKLLENDCLVIVTTRKKNALDTTFPQHFDQLLGRATRRALVWSLLYFLFVFESESLGTAASSLVHECKASFLEARLTFRVLSQVRFSASLYEKLR